MDQDKTNDPEKRNWREKLGIGTNGAAKELPKISADFKKAAPVGSTVAGAPVSNSPRPIAPRVDTTAKPPVRPAPMAPRPGSAPMSRANPKPATPSPVSPDKLAERLRSQRDASTKLAEQRVQVARQRADAPAPVSPHSASPAPATSAPAPSTNSSAAVNAGPKPKFTFAEEEANNARQMPAAKTAAPVQRPPVQQVAPSVVQPVAAAPRHQPFQPQQNVPPALTPSRPSLGAPPQQAFQQRPQQTAPAQPYAPQPAPGYPPQGYGQQPPGYRPIDPATGYPQQPYSPYGQPQQYQPQQRPPIVPNQRFGAPPSQVPQTGPQVGYVPPGSGPRLNVPQRPASNSGFQPETSAFNSPPSGMRQPPRVTRPADDFSEGAPEDGLFDEPTSSLQRPPGRRPTPVDYQQAYRDAEAGFEDEAPPSRLPWILPGILVAGAALAGILVWLFVTQIQPMMNGTQRQAATTTTEPEVPVVPAPTQPARAQPEQNQQSTAVGGATRKQIYDRIVGDKEVLGGQMVPTEQVPAVQPGDASGTGTGDAAAPQGGDAVPLPIPPPPGSNTQGALPTQPEDPNKQSAENITPAAGESQAAVAVPAPGELKTATQNIESNSQTQIASAADANTISPAAAPAEEVPVAAVPKATDAPQEVLTDAPKPETRKAITPKKKIAASLDKLKQLPKKQMASLGSKPVVLVPATKRSKAQAKATVSEAPVVNETQIASTDNGLYGNDYIVDSPATNAAQASVPKKRNIFSTFLNTDDTTAQTASNSVPAVTPPKPAAPVATPVQQASAAGGGYVAQLGAHSSNAEATAAFARLKSRNAGVLGGVTPIITKADVNGSTFYRLAVGPFASRDAANAMCSKLFAAGERDCLVRR